MLYYTIVSCVCLYVAGLLVVIDYILVHGPGKNVILRHFGQRSITEKEQVAAYRLCGQVSARIIGVFFLLFMVR